LFSSSVKLNHWGIFKIYERSSILYSSHYRSDGHKSQVQFDSRTRLKFRAAISAQQARLYYKTLTPWLQILDWETSATSAVRTPYYWRFPKRRRFSRTESRDSHHGGASHSPAGQHASAMLSLLLLQAHGWISISLLSWQPTPHPTRYGSDRKNLCQ
jgi:hypothetical protein